MIARRFSPELDQLVLPLCVDRFCFLVWPRLDPRMFGHPNGRLRSWRICFHRKKKQWTCPFSLQQLAEILLAPIDAQLKLDYMAFLRAPKADIGASDVFETALTEYLVGEASCVSFSLEARPCFFLKFRFPNQVC